MMRSRASLSCYALLFLFFMIFLNDSKSCGIFGSRLSTFVLFDTALAFISESSRLDLIIKKTTIIKTISSIKTEAIIYNVFILAFYQVFFYFKRKSIERKQGGGPTLKAYKENEMKSWRQTRWKKYKKN